VQNQTEDRKKENDMFAQSAKKIAVTAVMTGIVAGMTLAGPSQAGSLENLERERALLVETMLDPALSVEGRSKRVESAQYRLIDLERMVLRDVSLRGKDSPIVRRAYQDYDLTFLVHASVEQERGLVDHWLDELGISTEGVMASRKGGR
jgi:hypothetical protein